MKDTISNRISTIIDIIGWKLKSLDESYGHEDKDEDTFRNGFYQGRRDMLIESMEWMSKALNGNEYNLEMQLDSWKRFAEMKWGK